MKKLLLLTLALIVVNTSAQENLIYEKDSLESPINRWTIGLAYSSVENNGNGSGNPFNNFFAFKKEDAHSGIPIRLNIEYRLGDLFGLEVSGSLNKWNANEGYMDSEIITEDYNYFAIDAGLKIYLDELFLDEFINWGLASDWLDVYVTGGVGYFKINEGGTTGNIGMGANVWVTKNLGVGAYWVAKWALDDIPAKYDTNHTQYSLGLTYRFNYKDEDEDGIYDYNDRCPNIPGTKAGRGCPDADDETPVIVQDYDSDNDGVIDRLDKCPNIVGVANYDGCPIPDSDGDGVLDDVDNCPKTAGAISNKGCPILDSDNDGVIDSADKCPEIAGVASNNGCPEVKVVDVVEIERLSKQIQFNTNKDTFTEETYSILQHVISFINTYPNSRFRIEGHTDSVGKEESNRRLSQRRADAVKAYLVRKGVSEHNLEAVGYGETQPIASNMSKDGRRMNRRVEIFQID
ncbi:MAG: OmpA family protein [Polaribacter sp.]